MNEEKHTFQLSKGELGYLRQLISNEEPLAGLLRNYDAISGSRISIRLERDEVERLRDYLTKSLAAVGFQSDYSLTEQGKMLEELIDRLYLP